MSNVKRIVLPPPGRPKRVNLTVPLADYQRLEALAKERGEAVTTLALNLIRAALDSLVQQQT